MGASRCPTYVRCEHGPSAPTTGKGAVGDEELHCDRWQPGFPPQQRPRPHPKAPERPSRGYFPGRRGWGGQSDMMPVMGVNVLDVCSSRTLLSGKGSRGESGWSRPSRARQRQNPPQGWNRSSWAKQYRLKLDETAHTGISIIRGAGCGSGQGLVKPARVNSKTGVHAQSSARLGVPVDASLRHIARDDTLTRYNTGLNPSIRPCSLMMPIGALHRCLSTARLTRKKDEL